MDLGIKGRLALVTGASKNIGKAIAQELAREGARVVIVARSVDGLEAVRRDMKDPGQHHCVALDLMEEKNIQELARVIQGIGPLDIMVHNLGGSNGVFQPFAPASDWAKVWQYNLGIGHELNRIFIPPMIERKWGRVVHLSTLSTRTHKGYAPYVVAKCAVDGYVTRMSREISKHNVIMSAVQPGAIVTEGRYFAKIQKENPAELQDFFKNNLLMGRLGQCEEVGRVTAFLCSEQAGFMAGSIVAVDGGGM